MGVSTEDELWQRIQNGILAPTQSVIERSKRLTELLGAGFSQESDEVQETARELEAATTIWMQENSRFIEEASEMLKGLRSTR